MTRTQHLFLVAAIAANTSTVLATTPEFTWLTIEGTLTASGPGGSLIQGTLGLDTPGRTAQAEIAGGTGKISAASASFDETSANGFFLATAPDGLVSLDLAHAFGVTEDGQALVSWDFSGLTVTEAAARIALFDVTNSVLLLEQDLDLGAASGEARFDVFAGHTYTWEFSGAITNRNAGQASGAIQLIPSPASAALLGISGVLAAGRRRH